MHLDLCDAEQMEAFASDLQEEGIVLDLVINCTGLLHDQDLRPERTWAQIQRDTMQRSFHVHATGVAIAMATLIPCMPRDKRAIFATLSARIGSIEDNRLGGWYSYRASKAAQNMLLKTASIEARRKWPKLCLVALHPGTVRSDLSAPFTQRLPDDKVFRPEQSAEYLFRILDSVSSEDSGSFFAWDGSPIPW
jgi:NAD(P)-dependent dehydrogenase (short-subunit alcohol dehydrogenase family)